MNILFWIWYAKYKEKLNEDDSPIIPGDDYIPSPIILVIAIMLWLAVIGICWLLVFK